MPTKGNKDHFLLQKDFVKSLSHEDTRFRVNFKTAIDAIKSQQNQNKTKIIKTASIILTHDLFVSKINIALIRGFLLTHAQEFNYKKKVAIQTILTGSPTASETACKNLVMKLIREALILSQIKITFS